MKMWKSWKIISQIVQLEVYFLGFQEIRICFRIKTDIRTKVDALNKENLSKQNKTKLNYTKQLITNQSKAKHIKTKMKQLVINNFQIPKFV